VRRYLRWAVRRLPGGPDRTSIPCTPSGRFVGELFVCDAGARDRWVSPADVARLNRVLRADVEIRFDLVAEFGPESGGGVGCRSEACGSAVATLVHYLEDGRLETASSSISFVGSRRDRLRLMASAVGECAMALGLGTGVYGEAALGGTAQRAADAAPIGSSYGRHGGSRRARLESS